MPDPAPVPDFAAAPEPPSDLGLGRVLSDENRQRTLRPDGSFNVRRTGLGVFRSHRLYHDLVAMSWTAFIATLAVSYVVLCGAFAAAFWALGPGALDAPAGDAGGTGLVRAFYFSVQTFATIGFGRIAPVSHAAEALVAVEAFVGILYTALATGLTFARVARPDADVVFSRTMLVAPYRGGWGLMFRLANARRGELSDLAAEVTFSILVPDPLLERRVRRFTPLPLERDRVALFPLTWTVVHPLGPDSPLHSLSGDDLLAGDAEVFVRIAAIDETTMQAVHVRTSYRAGDGDVVWYARFRDLFDRDADVLTVDVSRLDETDPVEPPDAPLRDGQNQASTASTGASAAASASV